MNGQEVTLYVNHRLVKTTDLKAIKPQKIIQRMYSSTLDMV